MLVSYRQLVNAENILARIFKQAKPQGVALNQVIVKLAKMKKALLPFYSTGEYAEGYKRINEKYLDGRVFKGETPEEQESNFNAFNQELTDLVNGLKDVELEYPEISLEELFSLSMEEPLSIDELGRLEPFFK